MKGVLIAGAVVLASVLNGHALWLSSHPGPSSMGKLLSLVCTLAAAVLFQPMLTGPPREIGE